MTNAKLSPKMTECLEYITANNGLVQWSMLQSQFKYRTVDALVSRGLLISVDDKTAYVTPEHYNTYIATPVVDAEVELITEEEVLNFLEFADEVPEVPEVVAIDGTVTTVEEAILIAGDDSNDDDDNDNCSQPPLSIFEFASATVQAIIEEASQVKEGVTEVLETVTSPEVRQAASNILVPEDHINPIVLLLTALCILWDAVGVLVTPMVALMYPHLSRLYAVYVSRCANGYMVGLNWLNGKLDELAQPLYSL